MNFPKSLHYLTETDKDFITDTMTTLIGEKTLPTNETNQRLSQSKFYRELSIDNDYCFGNPSELSKKSKKLIKSLQKQQKSFDTTHKEDQAEESREMTPFQIESEISSISYAVEQSTPCDSVFSKIMKHNQNSKTQSEQFQDEGQCGSQFGSANVEKSQVQQEQNVVMTQNPQIRQSSQENARQCPIQTFDTQANDIQQLPIAQQPVVQYVPKQSALQFKDYNAYVRNYLKKRPLDVIIHPEYSAYVEDCSQLAVQGRLMMLQANKRLISSYNVLPKKRITPDSNNLLDQIFGKGVRPQYHEQEGEKRQKQERKDEKQTDK